MGKLKSLLIEEDFMSLNGVSNDDIEAMLEESHYWGLVDSVAQWIFNTKNLSILDDIEKKYLEYWSKQ